MPVCYPDQAGKPYRPSNGTEGEMFQERYCYRCVHDANEDSPCEILTAAMVFGLEDAGYPREWLYDANGRPSCTAFLIDNPKERAPSRCPDTPDLFGEQK